MGQQTDLATRLPTFVIIGAMRCGTTSVHAWLSGHPDISMSRQKELSYFVTGRHGNHDKGLDWYADQFDPTKPNRGESSPKYTKDPIFPGVAERMHALLPDARLIYLVRDPIARLISHYTVIRLQGWEKRPLAKALADVGLGNKYVAPGLYAHQLDVYRVFYPDERILVASLEDVQRDPAAEMGRIIEFLGLSADSVATLDLRPRNRSGAKRAITRNGRRLERRLGARALHVAARIPGVTRAFYRPMERPVLDAELRARLEAVYRPDAGQLRSMTGQAFRDWSV